MHDYKKLFKYIWWQTIISVYVSTTIVVQHEVHA